MSSNTAISIKGLTKIYRSYDKPIDRLLQMLPWFRNRIVVSEFCPLGDINLQIAKGEVVGVVGQNGAGKSTLLQLICKTLEPTSGSVVVKGKIAALLELGSGFNPEFTGRENVFLSAAISGMGESEIAKKYDSIVEFSGIGDFIDNPVKTYSSGMMVRLAFAVATSIEPEILVIDEALSVGDGAFARKSFEKIMELKDSGCTILFCSHTLYQVEVLCDKVMWLKQGNIEMIGKPSLVIYNYQKYLDNLNINYEENKKVSSVSSNIARITNIRVFSDDGQEKNINVMSEQTDINIDISFVADIQLTIPTVGIVIYDEQRKYITSCGSFYDDIEIVHNDKGDYQVSLCYPKIGLLKGKYYIDVVLLCDKAIHIYEEVHCATLMVIQKGNEVGMVCLPRSWNS